MRRLKIHPIRLSCVKVVRVGSQSEGTLTLLNSLSSPQTLIHLTVIHLTVTKKYLFGIDGSANIYSYSTGAKTFR